MISNELTKDWFPEYYAISENKTPKFLYRVDSKIPEEVFQKGLTINNFENFSFFDYFFNVYACTSEAEEDCFINAFETPYEAIINFRKNLFAINQSIKDLYLYVIRCDNYFFSKQITRCSIPSAIVENQILTKNRSEMNKLIFAFSDYGQKYSNNYEWFTVRKIENIQIYSAASIKLNFKKNNNQKTKNSEDIITPEIEDIIFRNPNYLDLNTRANSRGFVYPEFLTSRFINYRNEVFYFEHKDKFISTNNPNTRILVSDSKKQKANVITKKSFINIANSKIKVLKTHFYQEEITPLFYDRFIEKQKCLNYTYKQPKPLKLIFSYEKFPDKNVYLNVSTTKKRGTVFFTAKTKNEQKINKVFFDKMGRIIFEFNNNAIPFALTLVNFDKSKDLLEIDSLPACINNINQNFHLEYAYSGFFYLKPNYYLFQHLKLAIKHNNNSFVFLNPKRKYNFSYDLVNLQLLKYPKKYHHFIYGMNVHIPDLININLNWVWRGQFFKPNLFLEYNNHKKTWIVQQTRPTEAKVDMSNLIYCLNTLTILFVDYNPCFKETTDIFAMENRINNASKDYRWLKWKKIKLSKYQDKNLMWVLRKSRYDKNNYYWIVSFLNNDYLWIQEKGENWGFFFIAKKNSKPLKSTSLFYLNESFIK